MRSSLAIFAVMTLAIAAKPPATGWLMDYGVNGQVIFPSTATQCDPYYIYYNTTGALPFYYSISASPVTQFFFTIDVPAGIGYLEWICNIPAGIAFHLFSPFYYLVQPGSSSACLGDLTTSYSLLEYATSDFSSYTRYPYLPTTTVDTAFLSTVSFPSGTFPTITLNPNLAVTPTTSSPVTPPPTSARPPLPSPTPAPSHKSRGFSVAGGVIGAVAFVLLILLIIVLWRKRRSSMLPRAPSPIDPEPMANVGPVTEELGHTPLSTRPSGEEFHDSMLQNPLSPSDPLSHGDELAFDSGATTFQPPPGDGPEASRNIRSSTTLGQKPPQGATTPLEAGHVLPSQSRRESPCDGQTLLPGVMHQPPTSETQEGHLDLSAVLGVISRAQLSPREREIVASVNNLLAQPPSPSLDLARQSGTSSPPPPYISATEQ